MAKDNFLLKDEWGSLFASLPDAKAGQLIKAVFSYHSGEEFDIDDPVLSAVFEMIRVEMYSHLPPSGSDHWNWKGGITETNHAIRESTAYKNWRKDVFERDQYTCQCCGAKCAKINAHHIRHFSDHPDCRLDVENGVTLCVDCHKEVHRHER